MKCIHCDSEDVVFAGKRYNKSSTKQAYKCNSCKKHFVEGEYKGSKFNKEVIKEVEDLHKRGFSLSKIKEKLLEDYNIKISRTAIAKWEKKIDQKIKKTEKDTKNIKEFFEGKRILITGGAGSIGESLTKNLITYNPKVVRILDNDEERIFLLQEKIAKKFPKFIKKGGMRYLLGDIRDKERLNLAFKGADIIFHLAAFKHVRSSEYNAFEAVKTNVLGTQNVISAALENDVAKVIYTSSDKAVNPNNTMGTTKLLSEKLVTSANYYKGTQRTIFASVRFGNVMGSSGSVIPLFKRQIVEKSPVTVTDPNMTRFMMSRGESVNLLIKCAVLAEGGEIFILKMPTIILKDLVEVIINEVAPKNKIPINQVKVKIIGPKEGETFFEELMTGEEASRAYESKDFFIIPPAMSTLPYIITLNTSEVQMGYDLRKKYEEAKSLKKRRYASKDEKPLSQQEIKLLLYKEELI